MQIHSIATHRRICRGKGIHRDCRVYDEPENIQMKGGDRRAWRR